MIQSGNERFSMKKRADAMSPRTQAFQMGMPSGDEESRLFEEGLSNMAYNVLVSKFPDMIQNVITFKILDTDVEQGAGIGAFVVQHGNEVIYVPVVMADNQVKPLDLFYHKGLNVFLPLNNDWLNEVSQLTVDEMGEAVKQPQSLRRDVDTRNILIPPTTGRYAYAAARGPVTAGEVLDDLRVMMKQLEPYMATKVAGQLTWPMTKVAATRSALLLDFLGRAPRVIKTAFVNLLTSRPKLAAQVTQLYGLDPLCAALEKVGADEGKTNVDEEGELNIADRKTTANEFKDIFGAKAPEAFQGMLAKGYAAQDNRKNLKRAVQIQEPKDLTVPDKSGFYRVFTADGDVKPAFIITNPRHILSAAGEGPELAGEHGRRPGGRAPKGPHHPGCECGLHDDFLVILKDGQSVQTRKLVAEPAWGLAGYDPSDEVYFKQLLGTNDGAQPKVGDRGIFVKKLGQTFVATEPFHVGKVSTDSQGVRRISCDNFNNTVLITDPKAAKAGLHQPKGTPLVYIPADARFIRLKDNDSWNNRDNVTLLSKPSDVLRLFTAKFDAMGAPEVAVKNAGAGQFSIDGEPARDKIAAMERAARKHRIHFSAAENLVKQAELLPHGRVAARVVTDEQLVKVAQPMLDPSMGSAPGGAPPPGGDPSMGGGAPPPPPAPPSPLDIAMGEAQSQMQQQVAALQTQSQAIQDTAQMLMQVQQRAQDIATGGAAAVQQGSPPLMPGAAGGSAAPPAAPPAATPAPMGGSQPPMGGAPGGAPPQGGGMPQPAPQMPAGGMGAVMQTETPSAMEIQQQVNPQFLEQAGQFNDQGVFDAAAIASIGQSPSFRDMVVDYVPTLERALDNLGRIMLTLWMQEGDLKQQFGDEEFSKIEDNLRAVHEGLGELVLQMNRNAIVMPASPNSSGMNA
jgi:hypothetical protein